MSASKTPYPQIDARGRGPIAVHHLLLERGLYLCREDAQAIADLGPSVVPTLVQLVGEPDGDSHDGMPASDAVAGAAATVLAAMGETSAVEAILDRTLLGATDEDIDLRGFPLSLLVALGNLGPTGLDAVREVALQEDVPEASYDAMVVLQWQCQATPYAEEVALHLLRHATDLYLCIEAGIILYRLQHPDWEHLIQQTMSQFDDSDAEEMKAEMDGCRDGTCSTDVLLHPLQYLHPFHRAELIWNSNHIPSVWEIRQKSVRNPTAGLERFKRRLESAGGTSLTPDVRTRLLARLELIAPVEAGYRIDFAAQLATLPTAELEEHLDILALSPEEARLRLASCTSDYQRYAVASRLIGSIDAEHGGDGVPSLVAEGVAVMRGLVESTEPHPALSYSFLAQQFFDRSPACSAIFAREGFMTNAYVAAHGYDEDTAFELFNTILQIRPNFLWTVAAMAQSFLKKNPQRAIPVVRRAIGMALEGLSAPLGIGGECPACPASVLEGYLAELQADKRSQAQPLFHYTEFLF